MTNPKPAANKPPFRISTYLIFVLLLFFVIIFISDQCTPKPPVCTPDLLFKESFDSSSLNSNIWTTTGSWKWTNNGKAVSDDANQQPIWSKSGGGAMAISLNLLNNVNDTMEARIPIGEVDQDFVHLSFYHYVSDLDSIIRVEAENHSLFRAGWDEVWSMSPDTANSISSTRFHLVCIPINKNCIERDPIDSISYINLRFILEGNVDFWVLDDVEVWGGEPKSLTSTTFPTFVGDSLTAFGKLYEVDCFCTPYVPNEIVIQFKPNASEIVKNKLRETFNVNYVDTLKCDGTLIERWKHGENGIIDINEIIGQQSAEPDVEAIDYNKYNWSKLENSLKIICDQPITELPLGLSFPDSNDLKIAILDSGIDYNHKDLINNIFVGKDTDFNGRDDDNTCFEDDPIGWNFVKNNNNPCDDHGHGTHVAGIVLKNWPDKEFSCNLKLIPVKTHDEYGASTLFDVTCGTYYAYKQGASVLNCSWGWVGHPSPILSNAIEVGATDYNATIIASAGNKNLNLDLYTHYPSCDHSENVVGVASILYKQNGSYDLSEFSNYSPSWIEIGALGEKIQSTVPGNNWDYKTGTSMAAPVVTSLTGSIYCCNSKLTYKRIIQFVLDKSLMVGNLDNWILNGKIVHLNTNNFLIDYQKYKDCELISEEIFNEDID